mgnify:CR=1 FL=1
MMNGTDQNGDESGKRMVSGGDTLLWKSGICAGKDIWINRSMICFGRCKADVHRTLCPRQGARGLLMDGTAVESAFALLLTKVTKPPYPAKISFYTIAGKDTNLCAMSGTGFRKRGEEYDDETNNQWYDRDRVSGS